jgi:hypothetical protein
VSELLGDFGPFFPVYKGDSSDIESRAQDGKGFKQSITCVMLRFLTLTTDATSSFMSASLGLRAHRDD